MSAVTSLNIYTWEGKFVVVGEFGGMTAVRLEFPTYREALREFTKMAQREEIRYEAGIGSYPDR